jgi:hypothetical protein
MTAQMTDRFAPARAQIREQVPWLPNAHRFLAVPATALLWWALAFLAWTRAVGSPSVDSWPPTLPTLFTDLVVAVFGAVGASLVVVALVRRGGLAFLSVLLGFVVSAGVTLKHGGGTQGYDLNTAELLIMLVVGAAASLAGLAIGTAAIRSLEGFGFLGLLAVSPVVSFVSVVLLSPLSDNRWLVRPALAVLLLMIAWRRWSGVLLWPIFFALFWLLNVAMSALGYGAQTLRHPGGSRATVGSVADAMLDFVRSAWRVFLGVSWDVFWPAAVVAALVVAGRIVWRRPRRVGTSPDAPDVGSSQWVSQGT